MQVDFYHLQRDPVEQVLARIAERVLAGGGRLLVVTGDDDQAERVDRALWDGAETFLPHARAGGAHDRLQPLLIGNDCNAGNDARHVALVDGEWRDAALAFDRAFHFFDDRSIAAARDAWRGLAARDGVERRFWKQEGGRWSQVG